MNNLTFLDLPFDDLIRLLENNFGLKTDSYKLSHWEQYPLGTSNVISYLESRGSDHPLRQEIEFAGLQRILMKYFVGVRMTTELLDVAEAFSNAHFGPGIDGKTPAVKFNREGWQYIIDHHGGKLPLRIKAVPEGTVVPLRNVLATFEITDNHSFWLTNFSETVLSHLWYPSTVASNGREIKKLINNALHITTDDDIIEAVLPSRLHDFGYRGSTSDESAGIGGAAHLLNFNGTDNLKGIITAMIYYNAGMVGYSLPASEHSTVTSWGKENERKAIENMLDLYGNSQYVSIVSDSYDIFNAAENIFGKELKWKILEREGIVVIRPDSGDPIEVNRKLYRILWNKFPGHINSKGFKVLHKNIRTIQGDGIDIDSIEALLNMFIEEKISIENVAFGSGGGLLQKFDRDTYKFAIKCSLAIINGEEIEVQKDPITSKGKKSKAGRLKLVKDDNGNYYTASSKKNPDFEELKDEMVTIFENGEMVTTYTFDEIRERAKI